jgi:uncharacterized protein (DUF2147 family)
MKRARTVAMVLGVLLTASAASFAAQTPAAPAPAAKSAPAKKAPAAPATHATSGVVKSINDSSLVISKSATKGPETTFVVNSSTQKEGNVAVGSMVDVRYTSDGKTKTATAVTVHEAKPAKAKK